MLKLKILKDGAEVRSLELALAGKPELLVGRAEGADIRLDDRAVGREHALLVVGPGGIAIQKKSKFGKLSVNGAEVSEAALKAGDVINIADYQVKIEALAARQSASPRAGAAANGSPETAELASGDTPGMGVAALDSQPADGSISGNTPGVDLGDSHADAPAVETPAENSVSVLDDPGGGADLVDGLPSMDGQGVDGMAGADGFNADGEDRTAMISTSSVTTRLLFKSGEANVEEFVLKKGEISIGRGTTCDIVLADKKSSRKHLIIKRVGINYVAQDLGSANGTLVNGVRISEQELAGDDVLRIGDTEFVFKAESQDYLQAEQNQEFIAPPDEEMLIAEDQGFGGMEVVDPATGMPIEAASTDGAEALTGAIPGMASGESNKKQSLVEKFKALPPKKKLIFGGAAALLLMMVLQNEDEGAKKKPVPKPTASAQASDPTAAMFAALPEEKKQFVMNTYQVAYDLYKKQEYDKALYEVTKIHEVLPSGYKDSKEVESYAKKSIEMVQKAKEEEERKKAEERRAQEVAEWVAQADAAVNSGKSAEARELFAKVLEKDPENAAILRLRQQLDERENQSKAAEEAKREGEFKRKKLEGTLQEGRDLFAKGAYYDVIEKMSDALLLFSSANDLASQAQELIDKSREALQSKSKPHLDAAETALGQSDYTGARDHFYKALKVDSRNAQAKRGLAKIKDILHDRSRKIYIEASVLEGVSDFMGARAKYKECLDQAMQGDSYYGMCSRKFRRFELLDRSVASAAPSAASAPPGGGADPKPPSLPSPPVLEDPQPPAQNPAPGPADGAAANSGDMHAPGSTDAHSPGSGSAAPNAGGGEASPAAGPGAAPGTSGGAAPGDTAAPAKPPEESKW